MNLILKKTESLNKESSFYFIWQYSLHTGNVTNLPLNCSSSVQSRIEMIAVISKVVFKFSLSRPVEILFPHLKQRHVYLLHNCWNNLMKRSISTWFTIVIRLINATNILVSIEEKNIFLKRAIQECIAISYQSIWKRWKLFLSCHADGSFKK